MRDLLGARGRPPKFGSRVTSASATTPKLAPFFRHETASLMFS
jgi:hypothetical protein